MVANSSLHTAETSKQVGTTELQAALINVTDIKSPDSLKTKRPALFPLQLQFLPSIKDAENHDGIVFILTTLPLK